MALASTAAMGPISNALLRRNLSSTMLSSAMRICPTRFFSLCSSSITLPAISINVPGILADIWEGILRAVPKKKTSHMKKRHRQLAGKALKDVRSINTCPGCGKPKKAHTLCPYCMAEIQQGWKEAAKASKALEIS